MGSQPSPYFTWTGATTAHACGERPQSHKAEREQKPPPEAKLPSIGRVQRHTIDTPSGLAHDGLDLEQMLEGLGRPHLLVQLGPSPRIELRMDSTTHRGMLLPRSTRINNKATTGAWSESGSTKSSGDSTPPPWLRARTAATSNEVPPINARAAVLQPAASEGLLPQLCEDAPELLIKAPLVRVRHAGELPKWPGRAGRRPRPLC